MIGARDPMGLVGQTLDGQFRIDEFVGEGGFSVVYRGYHTGLGEIVAIKCLKLQSTLGSALVESFVRRFRDEGRILYRLSQGNLHIVRSMASGTTIAGTTGSLVPYTVLEWLEGHSLAQDFERRRAAAMRGRPMMEAAALFSTAFEAVAYAHQAGVVHRDLNPGNIFLTQTREGVKAKVLDFGVAKIVSDHALELGPRAQTIGQIKIFSPAYAAPEQFDEKLGKIGPYTDVYTLAIVFVEALRDEPALTGDNIGALITETLEEKKRPTPRTLGVAVTDDVENVFARALSIKPQDRQQSAGEFWTQLAGALNIRNISLPSPSLKTPPPQNVVPRKPQFGTQTVRMESPMQNAKPAPSAPALATAPAAPGVRFEVGPSGLASTVAAGNDMDGRFSATMIAPENLGTQPTLAAPQLVQAMQQPSTVIMQTAPPHPQPSSPQLPAAPAYGAPPMAPPPPILALQQAAPSSPAGFNDETGIVRVSSGPSPLLYAIVGVVLVLIGMAVALFLYSRHTTAGAIPIATASAVEIPAATTATATATATATSTATAAPTSTVTASALPTSTATSAPTSTATSIATSTSTSVATPTPTPTPTPVDPNAFNVLAANRALGTEDSILVSCADARGQKGTARVTFANDGTVQNVVIEPAALPGAECVSQRYKTAHTLRYVGPLQTVDHPFHVSK